MPVNHGIQLMDLDSIVVPPRDERQRKDLPNIEDLMDSIRRLRGLINAIVIRRSDRSLVAGERRYTAYTRLRAEEPDNPLWKKIPYKYLDEVDEFEADIIELEENVKREQLSWQEEAGAIVLLHEKYASRAGEEGWNLEQTASHVGYSVPYVSKAILVGKALRSKDKTIEHCESIGAAYNILNRAVTRAVADEMTSMLSTMKSTISLNVTKAPQVEAGAASAEETPAPALVKAEAPATDAPIINVDFHDWVQSYTGAPFNLIHCDFPYGIKHSESRMGYAKSWGGAYEDSQDVYWDLCHTFCSNLDKFCALSAHVIFWFSMSYYTETLEFLKKHAPSLAINPFPLIWAKNKGIVPDASRGPRRSYETALFMYRGDRKIISPVHNFIEVNAEKDTHISEKPVEMLRHFFRMVVDQNTRLFDPTCGSGTSLRAARSMGAKEVLGLEINAEFAKAAADKFKLASIIEVK